MPVTDVPAAPRSEYSLLNHWWVLVVRGLLAIVFGVLALLWPKLTIIALIAMFAAYALLDGITSIVAAIRQREFGWEFFGGVLSIVAGVLTIMWPSAAGLALILLIGAWAVARGVFDIAMAIALRKVIRYEWLLALGGVVSIAFGVFLLIWPFAGALAVVGVIAAWAIFLGILLVGAGFRQRYLLNRIHASTVRPAAP